MGYRGLSPILVAALLITNACGSAREEPGMKPTITLEEANRLVDEHIQQAVATLSPNATLEVRGHETDGSCLDPDDQGPTNRKSAQRSYKILGLESGKIPDYFDTLRTWWPNNNFRVLQNKPRNEYLWVENNGDSIRLSLQANDLGEVYINASSPCVWPNGIPQPER